MNEPRSEHPDRAPRRGDRDAARRGDRPAGAQGRSSSQRRDNTSYGERRGNRYDGGNAGSRAGSQERTGGTGSGGRGRASEDRRGRSRGDAQRNTGRGPSRDGRPGQDRHRAGRPGQDVRQAQRADEPAIPEDIEAADLDLEIRRDLRSLDKGNADTVSRHLVAAMYLVDEDPQLALAHGRAAKNRAGRIGVVRETLGVLAYRAGEWAESLGELRAARRISGGPGLLAMMADCERGLERPHRAIELARGEESRQLDGEDLIELRIVEAGARVDMEQLDAALVTLQDAGLDPQAAGESAARLDYAYAEVLLAAERTPEALEWFRHAVSADQESTDAAARIAQLESS